MDIKYASFMSRIIANLIDLVLMGLFFMPLFSIMANIIYGNVLPGEIIFNLMQRANDAATSGQAVDLLQFLQSDKEVNDYFVKNNGLIKTIINQIFQCLCLGAAMFFFWLKRQATIGKMCLSIKIVDAGTLGIPSSKQLFIRLLSLTLSVVPFCLGIIWIAFDPKKQGLHDKIANTLVIKNAQKITIFFISFLGILNSSSFILFY